MAKLRFEITKGDEIRYISHLDYAGAMEKAIRRANLPAAYSEGFNPHMKLAFASALSVGITSEAEYMDLELVEDMPVEIALKALLEQMPPGIVIKKAAYVPPATPALMAVVNWGEYSVKAVVQGEDKTQCLERIDAFNTAAMVMYTRQSPKGRKEINIKEYLPFSVQAEIVDHEMKLYMAIRITPGGSVKPSEVLDALVEQYGLTVEKEQALICRTGLYIVTDNHKLTPMQPQKSNGKEN